MIYKKNGMSYPESNRYYQCFEYMFILSKGKPKTFNPICDRKNKNVNIKNKVITQRQIDNSIIVL
jgi:site-specific DNA-methyltransferase (adenine-specific)